MLFFIAPEVPARENCCSCPSRRARTCPAERNVDRKRHPRLHEDRTGAIQRRLRHIRPAVLRAADDAVAVEGICHQCGAEQPGAVGLHSHAGVRPADHRPYLRPHRAQAGDGVCPGLRRPFHLGKRGDAELGAGTGHPRPGRPVTERPGSGGDDLPERRNPPAAHRPGHGPVYRWQRHWRHERAPDHRRADRFRQLAHGDADHRRPGLGCGAGVLEGAARIAQFPPRRR